MKNKRMMKRTRDTLHGLPERFTEFMKQRAGWYALFPNLDSDVPKLSSLIRSGEDFYQRHWQFIKGRNP